MRRTLMIITVALVLCLCGCSEIPQISDMPTEPSQSESLPIKDSEEISQETDAPQSSVNIDTPEESGIASETTVSDVKETETGYIIASMMWISASIWMCCASSLLKLSQRNGLTLGMIWQRIV